MTMGTSQDWPSGQLVSRLPFALSTTVLYVMASWLRFEIGSSAGSSSRSLTFHNLSIASSFIVDVETAAAYLGVSWISLNFARRGYKRPSECRATNRWLRTVESVGRWCLMAVVYWFTTLFALRLVLLTTWTNALCVVVLMQYPLWQTWQFAADIVRWWWRNRPSPGDRLRWWINAPLEAFRVLRTVFRPHKTVD